MRYTLSYDERLKKKIKKLDNGTKVILKKWIEKNLMDCEEPRSKGKPLRGTLSKYWRYRIGDYRLIVEIEDDQLKIIAFEFAHRNQMELLIVIIAVVLVAVIAFAFRTKPNTSGAVEQTPSTQESTPVEEAYIPEELEECVRELKRNGQSIKAIQKLRNVTGMSLSEAKQFVDDIII